MTALQQCRILVRVASLLVPGRQRRDWRKEWESEAWHAALHLSACGYSERAVRSQLWQFCWGAFPDAASCRAIAFNRENLLREFTYWSRSPGFCLAALAAFVLMLTAISGFLPKTRDVLFPLPYSNADRIVTVAQTGPSLAARRGIPAHWANLWKNQSKFLDNVATYSWHREHEVLTANVSENFFSLLGAHTAAGRLFERGDTEACADCVVLSYDYWKRQPSGATPGRVIGVLDKRFWFLSRDVAIWRVAAVSDRRMGVVARLRPEITLKAAVREMQTLVCADGVSAWDALIEMTPLQERVRYVLGSFGLALILATVITFAGSRLTLRPARQYDGWGALFFCAKTALALLAVLIAGIEFTRAASITMTGGTDAWTEPLSTWLFLLATMGALTWSIHDQCQRCRVCQRRLGLAAHVGCPGCMLFDWAGTELVCSEGHGMLHVPEMTSSWSEPEQWTSLDDSWLELFAR
ncbi:MAG TPA: hypothetical protein VKU01_30240 [Bryobacteraceae bacterium]|nr:hypothetical protein [Bryobacteraceae bacterium]